MSSKLKVQDKSTLADRYSIDLGRQPAIKFRARLLEGVVNGKDTHRTFTGCFFPRFGNMYLHEVVTTTLGGLRGQPTLRLVETYPLDVYTKAGTDGESFVVGDFVAGAQLKLPAPSAVNRDRQPRLFTITEVDTTALTKERQAEFEATAVHPPTGFQTERLRNMPESVRDSLLAVRKAFIDRCGGPVAGIKEIGRRFRIMDDSGDRFISKAEFVKSLKDVQCNIGNVDEIFAAMDADGNGNLSFEEIMEVVRGPMNARRKLLVSEAFGRLDSIKRDGVVTLGEMMQRYNAKQHPDVLAGRKTEAEVVREVMNTFEARGDRNGIITFTEFCDYYNGISASIDNDDVFELMLRNSWRISGGKGWCENTANKRVMIEYQDGRQLVVELTDDLGLDTKDRNAVINKLAAQGINISAIAKIDITGSAQ